MIHVFDLYPRLFQTLLCGLDEIAIVHKFHASGDTDGSGRISIRKDLAGGRVPLAAWASWNEQLPFFNEFSRYAIDPSKPYITALHRSDVNGTLMFILTHELAHVLDGLNSLTDGDATPVFGDKWTGDRAAEAVYGTGNGLVFCFYTLCPPIAGHDANAMYDTLYAGGFISLYAATSKKEDFADFMAFYVMREFADLRYFVHVPKGKSHDVMAKFDSDAMCIQTDFARNLLRRTDLKTQRQTVPVVDLDSLLPSIVPARHRPLLAVPPSP